MAAMSALVSVLLLASSSLAIAVSTGENVGHEITLSNILIGSNQIAPPSVCDIGPSYWCDPSTDGISQCGLDRQSNIGVCGYSSGFCPVTANATSFCVNYPDASTYNGGLTNLVPGQFGYYVLAMYWPPSSCPSSGIDNGGFCNAYTAKGTIGATTMQLHGLWPDYGSIYQSPGTPPFRHNIPVSPNCTNQYQGWPQYCAADLRYDSKAFNYSQCHVNGPLCPDKNITQQSDYDDCMAANHVPGCVVDPTIISALKSQLVEYGAGHLGNTGAFALHEFNKHGSCLGGYLTQSKQAYFQTAVSRAKGLRDNNIAIRLVQKRRGGYIKYATLRSALNLKGAAQCNSECQLTEIWFCYAKDANGFPSLDLIQCEPGNLTGDTCDPAIFGSKNCTHVIIPDFTLGPNILL